MSPATNRCGWCGQPSPEPFCSLEHQRADAGSETTWRRVAERSAPAKAGAK